MYRNTLEMTYWHPYVFTKMFQMTICFIKSQLALLIPCRFIWSWNITSDYLTRWSRSALCRWTRAIIPEHRFDRWITPEMWKENAEKEEEDPERDEHEQQKEGKESRIGADAIAPTCLYLLDGRNWKYDKYKGPTCKSENLHCKFNATLVSVCPLYAEKLWSKGKVPLD